MLRTRGTSGLCRGFPLSSPFFYTDGGYLLDAGWTAGLHYRNGLLPLWNPDVKVYALGSASYSDYHYQYHLAPLYSLYSLASYLFPLDRLNWYSLCQALLYTLMACSCLSLAHWFCGDPAKRRWILTGTLPGLVLLLNGFLLAFLTYPHMETSLLAFGLAFFVLLLRGHRLAAAVCFVLACFCREDAGFHLTALLSMLWVASYRERHLVEFRKRFLTFALLGFLSGVLLLTLQKLCFPLAEGVRAPLLNAFFENGQLNFSMEILLQRLMVLPLKSLVLLLPVAVTLLVAVLTRRWVLLLGWAAYVPWFLLNIVSSVEARQIFNTCHGFPFVFALIWPFLVLGPAPESWPWRRQALALVPVFLIPMSSILGLALSFPDMFQRLCLKLTRWSYQPEKPFEALQEVLVKNPDVFGRLGMDDSFACLYMDQVKLRHLSRRDETYDTLFFFRGSMFTRGMIERSFREDLGYLYQLTGTNALVSSNRDLSKLEGGGAFLRPLQGGLWLTSALLRPGYARHLPDGTVAQIPARPGNLIYGPFISLEPGRYRVRFELAFLDDPELVRAAGREVARVEVLHDSGRKSKTMSVVKDSDLPGTVSLFFEVAEEERGVAFEFCVQVLTAARLQVKGLQVEEEKGSAEKPD